MAETLQDRVFQPFPFKGGRRFPIPGLRALPSRRVIGKMLLDALALNAGQMFGAFHAQRQRQLRAFTKTDGALPRVLVSQLV
jgi:hypothetical protein